jgi:hypothetical protein
MIMSSSDLLSINSVRGLLHHAVVEDAANDLRCMLPPSSGSKMEVARTCEMSTVLPTAALCNTTQEQN